MVALEGLTVVFSFILLVVFLHKWSSTLSSTSKKRLPPSPLRLPLIGNFHLVGTLAHRSFQSLSKRYGELMLLHFGNTPVVVASSAKAAREIMKNQDLIFSNRPRLSIAERVLYNGQDVVFGRYGEPWRQARSICVLHLLSNERVKSFRRLREEETSLMLEKVRRSSPSVVNLSKLFMSLTNDVVCMAVLGRKYDGGDGENEFNQIMEKFLAIVSNFNVGDFIPWLAWINRVNGLDAEVDKVSKMMDDFMEGVLREYRGKKKVRESDDGVNNFVETLLELQRESTLDDVVIKAIILDMFTAGTDTTHTTLEWTMTELIRNSRAMKLLQKEVREVGRNKDEITEDDLESLPYLKAVTMESLRLHPPIPLTIQRELTKDTNLLGYDIPSGTHVLVNCWAIARDPLVWENPDEFRPERFLETSIDYRGTHSEMLPFGAGRRGCPGITFAMSLFKLALFKLVNEFDFKLPNGAREEDLDITESPGLSIKKKSPLIVVATSHRL